jgi:hypothetical protein
MRDIRALEVAVTNDDMRRIEQMLQAAGFGFLRDRGKITAHGADVDFTFHVVPADQIGLRSVEFVLNTPVPAEHIERIGKSTLTVGPGNRARWEFSESAK